MVKGKIKEKRKGIKNDIKETRNTRSNKICHKGRTIAKANPNP